jgi:serine/threonine-protein kinase
MTSPALMALLDRALTLQGDARRLFLANLHADEPAMHAALEPLLLAAAAPTDGLAAPVVRSLQFSAVALKRGDTVGAYRLINEIGRGGMAVVWLAERIDKLIERPVALKLPLVPALSAVDAARFDREKQVLAALNHANIARLYDAGVAPSGQPFIVLEYVDGQTIKAYCDDRCLDLGARLALFIEALTAVEHAHRHLVVHRDLKPSNILVTRSGELKLLDFGIARLLTDPLAPSQAADLTRHGALALTPLYAAPEQLLGGPISTATDVYMMGVVLHELLSGSLPGARVVAERPTLAQWVESLSLAREFRLRDAPLDEEAARRRGCATAARLRIALSGDLDVILQKAKRHAPQLRYGSAAHFLEDLRRYLDRKPVTARRPSPWYSMKLGIRRHKLATAAVAAGTLATSVATAVAWQKQVEARAYESRSIAVRDFMFDFVDDAEPSETAPDQPVQVKDMLAAAVARARQDFEDRPQLQGELLSELGRMYGSVGEPQLSEKILIDALTILESSAPPDDPALNKARTFRASALLDRGEVEPARALATKALGDCSRKINDCVKARSFALTLLGRIEARDGNVQKALETRKLALAATIEAYGRQHAMTVLSLQGLATVARNSGQLIEASTALQDAIEISHHVRLARADRIALERSMAVVDMDMGNYEDARLRLLASIPKLNDEAERALQLRLLATTLLEQGRPAGALESAQRAFDLAKAQQDKDEVALSRQARARAYSLIGEADLAEREIQTVLRELRALDYAEKSTEILRARRFEAEILLRGGEVEHAREQLFRLLAVIEKIEQPNQLEWGHALDLLGCASRNRGDPATAVTVHEAARTHLQKILPRDHPFLVRNTLYHTMALGNWDEFRRQAKLARAAMTRDSVWLEVIDAQLQPTECREPAGSGPECRFLL